MARWPRGRPFPAAQERGLECGVGRRRERAVLAVSTGDPPAGRGAWPAGPRAAPSRRKRQDSVPVGRWWGCAAL